MLLKFFIFNDLQNVCRSEIVNFIKTSNNALNNHNCNENANFNEIKIIFNLNNIPLKKFKEKPAKI